MRKDYSEPEYLTRSDIARILKISPKQAGRLMEHMPCVLVGTTHRRVSRPDFDAWLERKKRDDTLAAEAHRDAQTISTRLNGPVAEQPLPTSFVGATRRKARPLPPL